MKDRDKTQMNLFRPPPATGDQLKDAGMEAVGSRAEESGWMDEALEAISAVARAKALFTVDDLPDDLRDEAPHHNALGVLVKKAVKAGIMKRHGYTKSKRPSAHSRVVPVYASLHYYVKEPVDE